MNLIDASEFVRLEPEALDAYFHEKAAEIGLTVADAYRPAVLETLAALQTHAAILQARLVDVALSPARITPP